MKLLRYEYNGETSYGVLDGDMVKRIEGDIYKSCETSDSGAVPISKVRILSPVNPSKIVAVGLNYRDHAEEMKEETPQAPVIFIKPPTCVIGPEEKIIKPKTAQRVDFEAELAVVVKNKTKNITVDEAGKAILGYTCFNDVTARDLQKIDGQWTRAKSFDTFAPVGPIIETEISPDSLEIELYQNGILRQHSNTCNLIYKPEYLISFISRIMTLLPGDIIATGTPSGIGPISEGDTVEVRIENIGSLINYVGSES